jgi:catechol 2,3-dioxygenase-like lactoylglutathione lyase family enzyme
MNIIFVSSVAVIAPSPAESQKLFIDVLGLPLEQHAGSEYYSSEKVAGTRHFGVWPLSEAAEACFNTSTWPAEIPVPQASIEFEVSSEAEVKAAGEELREKGYSLLHEARTEPWGQTVVRTLTPEGIVLGISYAPWMHEGR